MTIHKKFVLALSLILSISLALPVAACHMDAMELSAHPHKMQMAANHANSMNAPHTQCTCGHQAFKTIQKTDKIFSGSTNWLSSALPVFSLRFEPAINEKSLFISGLLSPPDASPPPLYLLNSVFLN
jgi:hypothetical protein